MAPIGVGTIRDAERPPRPHSPPWFATLPPQIARPDATPAGHARAEDSALDRFGGNRRQGDERITRRPHDPTLHDPTGRQPLWLFAPTPSRTHAGDWR